MTRHEDILSKIETTKAQITQLEEQRAELQKAFQGGRSVDFGVVNQQLDGARSTLHTYEQELAKCLPYRVLQTFKRDGAIYNPRDVVKLAAVEAAPLLADKLIEAEAVAS